MNIKIGSKKMERNERKRQFLKWLISNYQHSNPSVNYLLQFLSTNSELMNNILFTDGAKYASRGIYISFNTNTKLPFIYYKDQLSYTLRDQAFPDIRLNNRVFKQVCSSEVDM